MQPSLPPEPPKVPITAPVAVQASTTLPGHHTVNPIPGPRKPLRVWLAEEQGSGVVIGIVTAAIAALTLILIAAIDHLVSP